MTETAHQKRGGKPFHSILEPHYDFMAAFRQQVNRDEDHRRAQPAIIAGDRHPSFGIVHAANHELGRQIQT